MNNSIIEKIDIFLSRKDQSLRLANQIESELLECFLEDEYVEEATDMLAQYRPGGGDYLFGELDMEKKLSYLKTYLLKNF